MTDKKGRVLAIVAHPDDEILGAGGTLARHAAEGSEVHIAFLADGVGARGDDKLAADRRAKAARLAASLLGAREPEFLGFPDNRLDPLDLLDITQALEQILKKVAPSTIYTHHAGDLNIDHALCHRAVLTACQAIAWLDCAPHLRNGSSIEHGMGIASTRQRIYADAFCRYLGYSGDQSGALSRPTARKCGLSRILARSRR